MNTCDLKAKIIQAKETWGAISPEIMDTELCITIRSTLFIVLDGTMACLERIEALEAALQEFQDGRRGTELHHPDHNAGFEGPGYEGD